MTIGDVCRMRTEHRLSCGPVSDSPTPPPEPAAPKTWLCWTLLVVNVGIWLVMVFAGVDPKLPSGEVLLDWGANSGLLTVQGQWWRLLSATFLHAGFVHLAFNGYFLWVIGRAAEQAFGVRAFALVYFGSGVLASLTSLLWAPEVVSVGASGALFGVFGAFLGATLRRRDVLPPAFVKSIYRNAVVLVVLNLAIGLTLDIVDLAAHGGGLLAGLAIGWLLAWLSEPRARTHALTPARRHTRALGLSSLATLAAIVLVLLAVPRWDDLHGALERYDAIEQQALARLDAARTPRERTAILRDDTLPAMDELLALLDALDHLPPRAAGHVVELREYTQARRDTFAAELDAAQPNR